MQNRTLSLVLSSALIVPIFAFAATDSSVLPTDIRMTPVDDTLQAEISGPDDELLATQPAEMEVDTNPAQSDPNMMKDPNMMENPNMMNDSRTVQDLAQTLGGASSNTTVPVMLEETRRIQVQ